MHTCCMPLTCKALQMRALLLGQVHETGSGGVVLAHHLLDRQIKAYAGSAVNDIVHPAQQLSSGNDIPIEIIVAFGGTRKPMYTQP